MEDVRMLRYSEPRNGLLNVKKGLLKYRESLTSKCFHPCLLGVILTELLELFLYALESIIVWMRAHMALIPDWYEPQFLNAAKWFPYSSAQGGMMIVTIK